MRMQRFIEQTPSTQSLENDLIPASAVNYMRIHNQKHEHRPKHTHKQTQLHTREQKRKLVHKHKRIRKQTHAQHHAHTHRTDSHSKQPYTHAYIITYIHKRQCKH